MDKNKRQQERNIAKAAEAAPARASSSRGAVSTLSQEQKKKLRDARKQELERSMLISKTATASMGKFDKKIEGEPKVKGVKRKVREISPFPMLVEAADNFSPQFEPTAAPSFAGEKSAAMNILSSIGRPTAAAAAKKKGSEGKEGDVNVRKAVRFNERQQRLKKGRKG